MEHSKRFRSKHNDLSSPTYRYGLLISGDMDTLEQHNFLNADDMPLLPTMVMNYKLPLRYVSKVTLNDCELFGPMDGLEMSKLDSIHYWMLHCDKMGMYDEMQYIASLL